MNDKIKRILEDFTKINSVKSLRRVLFQIAEIFENENNLQESNFLHNKIKKMPTKMNKEAINYILCVLTFRYQLNS